MQQLVVDDWTCVDIVFTQSGSFNNIMKCGILLLNSSVTVVIRLDDLRFNFGTEASDPSSKCLDWVRTHPCLYSVDTGSSFPEGKVARVWS